MATGKQVAAKSFCLHHNIQYEFIRQAKEHDLIEVVMEEKTCYIPFTQLEKLEKIVRLYNELDINFEGIETIFHLLDKLEEKEKELRRVNNLLEYYSKET